MKKIGIGYEKYKDFLDNDLYYVDKTMLIHDIWQKGGKVTLFTRPRRFGKTLALSMLRTFFELEYDRDGNVVDNSRYFEGMKIMDAGENIVSMMGQYPVIKLSLKSAKQPDYYGAIMKLREEIRSEFGRHSYLYDSDMIEPETMRSLSELQKLFDSSIVEEDLKNTSEETNSALAKRADLLATAIKTLSECLAQHHNKSVIILLDEYDVPLENAYYNGFYDEMVGFIRSLFESALKTNDALERAVITGCLRISKESIFTGLNHLKINSVIDEDFGESFGFVQSETEQMLAYYNLSEKVDEVREWYDGYLFGSSDVYNPWSVIKYIDDHNARYDCFPRPYWANTSSNLIIKDLIEHANADQKVVLENLISGGTIEVRVHEDITYDDVYENDDNLWNFLFFTGYMRKVSERFVNDDIFITMCIPNMETDYIFRNHIRIWFEKVTRQTERSELYRAIIDRDDDGIGRFVTSVLKKAISTFDSAESFYHGFFLSLLLGMPDYSPRSNREKGDGRPDIFLEPLNPTDPGYIFEIKIRKKFNEMNDGIQEAFDQIDDRQYEEGVLDEGYAGAISFGMCFCKKACLVKLK